MSNDKRRTKILSALRDAKSQPKGEAFLNWLGISSEEDLEIVSTYIKSNPDATYIRSLYLNNNKIGRDYFRILGDKGGEEICNALRLSQYCRLQFLNLGWAGIGKLKSMRALGEYLISPSSSHLKSLSLTGNNKIGKNKEGVKILYSALYFNSTLSNLNLMLCGIDDRGALMLQYLLSNYSSSLINLNLGNNKIDINLQKRITKIQTKYETYHRICRIIDSQSSSSSSSEDIGRINNNLSDDDDDDQRKILLYLQQIFEPLPPFTPLNNSSNSSGSGGVGSKLLGSRRGNNNICANNMNVFKWKILFICSIINSFT